jgi:hypothetical protein
MNYIRPATSIVNRARRRIFWRDGNYAALRARDFLWLRVISLWARLQQSLRNRTVRRLRVRETLALGDKRQLLIVECGERQLLIGAAGNFLTMLAELPVAEHTTSETTCE